MLAAMDNVNFTEIFLIFALNCFKNIFRWIEVESQSIDTQTQIMTQPLDVVLGTEQAKMKETLTLSEYSIIIKGELNPKIDFSWFEHLSIVDQLHEVFLSC